MIATAPLRTPGLYFEAHVPDPPEVLPRLDIAAFVGFAASGPLDVPVAVEDAARFEEIFGADLTLGTAAQAPRAQLGPAVRAFFRNGGRRCWVVRVAERPVANTFVLPGILTVRRTALAVEWAPAIAAARSEGGWSDSITANTTLLVSPQPRRAVKIDVDAKSFLVALDTGTSLIRAGDLLRIDVGPSWRVAFVPVPRDLVPGPDGRVELPWRQAVWLEEADREPWPFKTEHVIVSARHMLPQKFEQVQVRARARDDASRRPGTLRAIVTKDGGSPLKEGSWLEIDVRKTSPSAARTTWLLQIDRMWPQPASANSSQSTGISVEIEAHRAWRFVEPPNEIEPGRTIQAAALTFELWTRDAIGQSVRLSDLGLAQGHARFWGDLPTDSALFSSPVLAPAAQRGLARDVSHPRFPLAGPAADSVVLSLPLGVSTALRRERDEQAEPRPEPRLVRDGLQRIDARLFLDPELRDTPVTDLIEKAFRVRYEDDGRARRPLRGVHALIDLDEVSLIAAPDALIGVVTSVGSPDTPPGVTLGVDARFTDTSVWLTWNAVPEEHAVGYTLQQSETADFATPLRSERLEPGTSHELVTNEPIGWHRRRVDRPIGACVPGHWYRVRAEGRSGGGPWSNTVRIRPVAATFDSIEQAGADAPVLKVTSATGQRMLTWTRTGPAHYRLEWSPEPTFAAAQVLFDGAGDTLSIGAPLEWKYVRIRAQTTPPGAWSNTVRVGPEGDGSSLERVDTDIDENTALDVNKELLIFCAARGDVFAVLGAPDSITDEELVAYKSDLVGPFLLDDDRRTPSFGALYHPWLVVAQDRPADAEPRTVAPSGTICGLIAARTLQHGAWFAPANRRLAGVVSTARAVDRRSWAVLDAADVNTVVAQPSGFVTLSAHTLTSDDDLREISVRRLLILLRRLALREGPSLVFEPNGPDLRRSVRRQFERVLGLLFVRGALAGSTPAQAFQVVVDETNNPPPIVDHGRLVVELRVAPSRPLAYLVVRFVLRGGGGSVVVEGA
jgi:hypothetical protein